MNDLRKAHIVCRPLTRWINVVCKRMRRQWLQSTQFQHAMNYQHVKLCNIRSLQAINVLQSHSLSCCDRLRIPDIPRSWPKRCWHFTLFWCLRQHLSKLVNGVLELVGATLKMFIETPGIGDRHEVLLVLLDALENQFLESAE
jgi:hypothetical protein